MNAWLLRPDPTTVIKQNLINMATRFVSKWLLLGIDIFITGISFFLAYLIRFNLSMNFDISKMVLQLPLVVLIVMVALLITGSYKEAFRHSNAREVHNIFIAICLSSVFIILVNLIIWKLEVTSGFSIPLSIVILYSLFSFVGLTASRYVFQLLYNALVNRNIH